jgi:hypothetical protein
MAIITEFDKVNSVLEDNGLGILETAYIEVEDYSGFEQSKLSASKIKSILSGLSDEKTKESSQSKKIKVQFNPDSLSFSSGGGSQSKKSKTSIVMNEEGKATQAEAEDSQEAIDISFKLIFDRSTYKDSSVQPDIEQFLAMLKKPYVRQITFYWGTMCYKGALKSISAEYVLFNSTGIPMRAIVNLSMQVMNTGD